MLVYTLKSNVASLTSPNSLVFADNLDSASPSSSLQSTLNNLKSSENMLINLGSGKVLSIASVEDLGGELVLDNKLSLGESKVEIRANTNNEVEADTKEESKLVDPINAHHRLLVRSFTKLSQDALLYILSYRNSEAVRQHMLNTSPIAEADHLKFCAGLKNRVDRLNLLSSFDLKPTAVAALNFDEQGTTILDYGMYALGTVHPERSAQEEGRIPVYAIDKIIIAHMVLSRGITKVNFQFKHSNPKSLHVNLAKHHTTVIKEDSECVYTTLECTKSLEHYVQCIAEFCTKFNCEVVFDL